MRHLLSIALSSHGGNTAARGGPEEKETWEGVRVRGVQEVALALVRLLRAAVQLLMLSEQEALALRERELERQREEMTEAASAHEDAAASKDASENAQFRSTVAVLPLMDSYAAPPRWAALRAGSIGHDSGGEGNRRHEPEMVEGVRVIDEVMKVVAEALPAATEYALRRVGKEQTRDPAHGRSSTLLLVEMLSLAACHFSGAGAVRGGRGEGEGNAQQTELVKSAYALVSGITHAHNMRYELCYMKCTCMLHEVCVLARLLVGRRQT